MNWKRKLYLLEKNKEWDKSIKLMQEVIALEPNNADAYIMGNYLLMNLLVEEDYNTDKHDYYAILLKNFYLDSYNKFKTNPEYLFFTAITAYMSEWYFEIEIEDVKRMLIKAVTIEPENKLYQWGYYTYLNMSDKKQVEKGIEIAKEILKSPSLIETLKSKGAVGEYILDMMTNWVRTSKEV